MKMTTDEMANAIFEYGTSKHNFFREWSACFLERVK